MALTTADEIYEQMIKTPPAPERLRLVEKIVHDLSAQTVESGSPPAGWMSIRGIAPNLLGGEDTQPWVSRTRQESDEGREKSGRPPS